jgi:hypothetical protein
MSTSALLQALGARLPDGSLDSHTFRRNYFGRGNHWFTALAIRQKPSTTLRSGPASSTTSAAQRQQRSQNAASGHPPMPYPALQPGAGFCSYGVALGLIVRNELDEGTPCAAQPANSERHMAWPDLAEPAAVRLNCLIPSVRKFTVKPALRESHCVLAACFGLNRTLRLERLNRRLHRLHGLPLK